MRKWLYVVCTDDEYELPLAVVDTQKELAEKLEVVLGSISSAISRKTRYITSPAFGGRVRVRLVEDFDGQNVKG